MEEHNGDTLGRRAMAFWGTVAAILTFGLVLVGMKKALAPNDDAVADGGQAAFRTEKLKLTQQEQNKEYDLVSITDGIARVSPDQSIPFAAKTLAGQKAAPSKVKTPEGAAAAAAPPPGTHDPNLSLFEKK